MPDSQNKFGPFDMNWKDLGEQFMSPHKDAYNQDFSWIGDYVQDMLSQVLPDEAVHNSYVPSRLRPDVIDTHQYIIIRAKVPARVNTRKLKVFFNANQVRLTGLGEEEEVVQLPASGRFEGSKAILKDDILEIRIPKELNEHYQEIHIQYL